jgi:hypothetical protein
VIGDDVEELAHAALLDGGAELRVALFAAERLPQAVVGDDVVAVRRSGRRLEGGRQVDVRHPERVEVRNDLRCIREGERRPKL